MSTLFDHLAKTLSGGEWGRTITELLKHLLFGATEGALATNGTGQYIPLVGQMVPGTTEASCQYAVPQTGIMKNGRIDLTVAPGASKTRIFKLRKNGADTAMVITITGTVVYGVDSTNEITVAAGDLLDWWSDGGAATTPAASQAKASVEYHLR